MILHKLAFLPEGNVVETKVGGNSTVHRYSMTSGQDLAVKIYGKHVSDNEIAREKWVYENWTNRSQICDFKSELSNQNTLVTDWFQSDDSDSKDKKLEAVICFIESGLLIQKKLGNASFFLAKDMIRRSHDLATQVDERLSMFDHEALTKNIFFKDLFMEVRRLNSFLATDSNTLEFSYDDLIPSQSDIGFHNILSNSDECKMIDFEYYGLDSPHKLVGDFLLHPRNIIDENLFLSFMSFSKASLKVGELELRSLIPFLALKWSVIIMKRALSHDDSSMNRILGFASSYVDLARRVYSEKSWEESIVEFSEGKQND